MTSDSDKPDGERRGDMGGGATDSHCAELVTLITVHDPVEAEIIVAKLRSAGIVAYARHEALSVVWGLTVDGAGQNDIMVRPEDLEEARAALGRES
jgi:hypothetical protein